MPFKDSPEGRTHYYGDGCPEHPLKENKEEHVTPREKPNILEKDDVSENIEEMASEKVFKDA
jgi:hypothetical protein